LQLSESRALTLAEKYFGVHEAGPSVLVSSSSKYRIDPVSPFYNSPDPDAPSNEEMMKNFHGKKQVL
jgi:hypothetical protein